MFVKFIIRSINHEISNRGRDDFLMTDADVESSVIVFMGHNYMRLQVVLHAVLCLAVM